MTPVGFPHSGTPGSKAVCASPGRIAACRALLRLPAPRHPPCALDIFALKSEVQGPTIHRSLASLVSLLDLSVRNYPYVLSDEPGGVPPGSDSHRCRVDRTLEDERGPVIACSEVRTAMVSQNDLLGQG